VRTSQRHSWALWDSKRVGGRVPSAGLIDENVAEVGAIREVLDYHESLNMRPYEVFPASAKSVVVDDDHLCADRTQNFGGLLRVNRFGNAQPARVVSIVQASVAEWRGLQEVDTKAS
jgi:hypothetical protein